MRYQGSPRFGQVDVVGMGRPPTWLWISVDSNVGLQRKSTENAKKIEVIEESKLKFEPVSWTFQTIQIEIKVKKEAWKEVDW